MKESNLYLYSIVLPDAAHIDEICEDIKQQYENGKCTIGVSCVTLQPLVLFIR